MAFKPLKNAAFLADSRRQYSQDLARFKAGTLLFAGMPFKMLKNAVHLAKIGVDTAEI